MNKDDDFRVAEIERRIEYIESKNTLLSKQLGKIDALADALGYRLITIDTNDIFVFGNTFRAIKKELLEDTND